VTGAKHSEMVKRGLTIAEAAVIRGRLIDKAAGIRRPLECKKKQGNKKKSQSKESHVLCGGCLKGNCRFPKKCCGYVCAGRSPARTLSIADCKTHTPHAPPLLLSTSPGFLSTTGTPTTSTPTVIPTSRWRTARAGKRISSNVAWNSLWSLLPVGQFVRCSGEERQHFRAH